MTFTYLMVGIFIAWAVALFLTANVAIYIENLVKIMKEEGDI